MRREEGGRAVAAEGDRIQWEEGWGKRKGRRDRKVLVFCFCHLRWCVR